MVPTTHMLDLALVATSTSTPVDPTLTITNLIASAQTGEWLWFVGGILMLVVWALRNFVMKALSSDKAIYVATAIGVLVAVAGVFTGSPAGAPAGATILKALGVGLTAGLASGGFWSLIGKKILGKPEVPSDRPGTAPRPPVEEKAEEEKPSE